VVASVGNSGFSPELLLAYSKANNNTGAIANEQVLKLRQAKAEQVADNSLPEGSTVSRYA
jgi:hypothetical protein